MFTRPHGVSECTCPGNDFHENEKLKWKVPPVNTPQEPYRHLPRWNSCQAPCRRLRRPHMGSLSLSNWQDVKPPWCNGSCRLGIWPIMPLGHGVPDATSCGCCCCCCNHGLTFHNQRVVDFAAHITARITAHSMALFCQ